MKDNKIRLVERAGGLAETNSSSSHALSICSTPDTFAKPGDPEFDLDIRDNILYVPERIDDFGWEYEKSNSCQTKLQYVCGLVFNNWNSLHIQKAPKKLVVLLKKYLGVDDVVFEWEENYKKHYKENQSGGDVGDTYLSCPEIDHQSRSESMEEILENNTTILNFIFNKNSWYFGGNDNSDAPDGYYKEMSISGSLFGEDDEMINATVSIVFGGSLGRVDFRVNMYSDRESLTADSAGIVRMIENSDGFGLFKCIGYNKDKAEFEIIENLMKPSSSAYSANCDFIDENNKCYLVYVNSDGSLELINAIKEDRNKKGGPKMTTRDLVNHISEKNRLFVPVQLVSDEFGEIYVP